MYYVHYCPLISDRLQCAAGTCTTLTNDATVLKACMTDPSAAGCTGTYSTAASLPATATNLGSCMADISGATCTASYGASSNLLNNGGKGVVGYLSQMSESALTRPARLATG